MANCAHAEVRAFAGAGKTYQLVRAVRRAIQRGMRMLVIANTNDQVRDIARRLADPRLNIVHLAADGEQILNPAPGLISTHDSSRLAGARCVVCTVYQAGKAAQGRPAEIGVFDVGFVDEAYQVRTSTEALWALRLAPRWAFVGDPGQLEVFTTLEQSPSSVMTIRWPRSSTRLARKEPIWESSFSIGRGDCRLPAWHRGRHFMVNRSGQSRRPRIDRSSWRPRPQYVGSRGVRVRAFTSSRLRLGLLGAAR